MSRISRPVWLLGWSSLFTDAATEMIYPVLPVYLSRVLGAGAFSLGLIEGIAEAVNSLLKVASGWAADSRAHGMALLLLVPEPGAESPGPLRGTRPTHIDVGRVPLSDSSGGPAIE